MYPNLNAVYLKIGIVLLLSPATFLRTFRHLAVSSVIGVAASFSVVSIIVWEGSNVEGPPGSIINPAPTTLYPHGQFANIGMAIGLIFVGFDGHSVFPSILRDLKKKTSFDTAMNWTFLFNLLVYLTIASCGYLMFGNDTLPEIGLNLSEVERFSGFLVGVNMLLTALNSMTKYPLYFNPLVSYLEQSTSSFSAAIPLRPYFCVALNFALLSTAIMIPSFHKLMGLVGATFTCVVAIIFPCACYLQLEEEKKTFTRVRCWIAMIIGFVAGVIGTWGTIMH
jgi:vesicular inhibitory amino acid transporter